MTNNTPDYEDNLYFPEQKSNGDLTEQWKKGELPEGHYYIKTRSETNIDEYIQWYKDHGIPSEKSFAYFNVQQVLAEVPDYIEWKNMVNCACEEHKANTKLLEENAQLKELLKECKEPLEVFADKKDACEWNPEDLLAKIDEALK